MWSLITFQLDIEKYCADIAHIGGAARLCLDENIAHMSVKCRKRPTLEHLGYTKIREIEFERGQYEIEATSPEGVKFEIYIDAVTGKVLRVKRDD